VAHLLPGKLKFVPSFHISRRAGTQSHSSTLVLLPPSRIILFGIVLILIAVGNAEKTQSWLRIPGRKGGGHPFSSSFLRNSAHPFGLACPSDSRALLLEPKLRQVRLIKACTRARRQGLLSDPPPYASSARSHLMCMLLVDRLSLTGQRDTRNMRRKPHAIPFTQTHAQTGIKSQQGSSSTGRTAALFDQDKGVNAGTRWRGERLFSGMSSDWTCGNVLCECSVLAMLAHILRTVTGHSNAGTFVCVLEEEGHCVRG